MGHVTLAMKNVSPHLMVLYSLLNWHWLSPVHQPSLSSYVEFKPCVSCKDSGTGVMHLIAY